MSAARVPPTDADILDRLAFVVPRTDAEAARAEAQWRAIRRRNDAQAARLEEQVRRERGQVPPSPLPGRLVDDDAEAIVETLALVSLCLRDAGWRARRAALLEALDTARARLCGVAAVVDRTEELQ